ncbi:hypothetical protein GWI33_018283 [Rhynchophorus ferrugineus]|uniref:G-protein coupled receptors family 1 profile domain-containing protein n=1 Tax=Rhynchophorus ferrugineus TaxID=354439 RepID=A0A834M1N4_RHYFE|nr:hypothetical protein GWI33_018283 [Rhynchophorus ferrugineus]
MRNTLNESACAAVLENVDWLEPNALVRLTILLLIDVMVIVGNCLVIAAVLCSSKLQLAVTNIFIASLAVADLMVGVAVLPFSSVWEVFKIENIQEWKAIKFKVTGVVIGARFLSNSVVACGDRENGLTRISGTWA